MSCVPFFLPTPFFSPKGGVEVAGKSVNRKLQRRAEDGLELAFDRLDIPAHLREKADIVVDRGAVDPVMNVVRSSTGELRVRITIPYEVVASRSRFRQLTITHEAAHAEQWFKMVDELGEARALDRWNGSKTAVGTRQYNLMEIQAELRARNAIIDLLKADVKEASEAYVRKYGSS